MRPRELTLRGLILGPLLALAVVSSAATAQPAVRDTFFDSKGVRIRYVESGRGVPVVLLHGYTGTLDRHWINPGVFAKLAEQYRAIALDLRGHGKSGKPHEPEAYGPEMGQDVVRLLDHLGISRAHIVGFSMGAMIAGQLLTTNADRFLTATFVGYHPVRTWTDETARESEASARELESDTPFKSLVLGIWPKDAPPPSDDSVRKLARPLAAANDLKALAAYHRARKRMVVTDAQLASVRVPTLGIIGDADPSVGTMRELPRVMPALELIVVEGAAHGGERGILRRAEFMDALRRFLAAPR
jgi:pimeloyl-ACP methyl ester carboxylesterase